MTCRGWSNETCSEYSLVPVPEAFDFQMTGYTGPIGVERYFPMCCSWVSMKGPIVWGPEKTGLGLNEWFRLASSYLWTLSPLWGSLVWASMLPQSDCSVLTHADIAPIRSWLMSRTTSQAFLTGSMREGIRIIGSMRRLWGCSLGDFFQYEWRRRRRKMVISGIDPARPVLFWHEDVHPISHMHSSGQKTLGRTKTPLERIQ